MLKILQNKFFYRVLIFILLFIVFYFSYLSAITHYKENFGYEENEDYKEPQIYPNFITSEEADYILEQSKQKFEDSTIIGGYDVNIRKSQTCWLYKTDETIKNIIQRVCDMHNYPIERAEDLQVVKYDPNGYYNEHHDSCCDENKKCKEFIERGGNRVVTMVIYLNDDFEGGATRFINLDKDIKPDKYSGILFYPMNKSGKKCHRKALHAGLPVTSGNKYIANVWIREHEFI